MEKSRNSALNFLTGWNTFILEVVDLNWLEMLPPWSWFSFSFFKVTFKMWGANPHGAQREHKPCTWLCSAFVSKSGLPHSLEPRFLEGRGGGCPCPMVFLPVPRARGAESAWMTGKQCGQQTDQDFGSGQVLKSCLWHLPTVSLNTLKQPWFLLLRCIRRPA